MKGYWILLLLALACFLGPTRAQAQVLAETGGSPQWRTPAQLKHQAIAIASGLRCPMSTNQSLQDSQSPIANELKAEIYLQLEQGKTSDEIVDFMVVRYGERIRYMPSLSAGTALLFFAPLCLLALAIFWYFRQIAGAASFNTSQEDRS
ncbi:cytochrome c-type biogenesis protein [Shewanella loihica]|uniref:Cytochrome c-type biogenesis protein n=1 Tax=Shewanella loihica (strain ATCC BAA-1088 / PV-4) TaxID=323850 RepID=A3Q9S0_SHELP|nr:cytochrome c-type biogenesis protein [Shewanella loihica]ABO22218.1 cytochrome C biogenesis protein [Shewanella loihica PV-4]